MDIFLGIITLLLLVNALILLISFDRQKNKGQT